MSEYTACAGFAHHQPPDIFTFTATSTNTANASAGRLQLVTSTDPDSPPAEAYRDLRTAVRFLVIDHTLKLVQVTSPRPGGGGSDS